MIPSRKEISKFMNQHPFLSIAFTVAGAFTIYETINAVKAPKGQGPLVKGLFIGAAGFGHWVR